MCVLCVMKPNSTPTREELMTAAEGNPHGFGYAIHCGDRILTGRGMDAEEVIDRFLRIRSGMPDTWAMFHARFTTHGATNKSNCHPFRVGGDPSTVIGHNGIIPLALPAGDPRSDTRFFADEWMPELLEHLDDEEMFEEIEDVIGYSKIAVFTHDPRLKYQVYILGEELGHWNGDIWWSNDGYKPYVYDKKKYVSYTTIGDRWSYEHSNSERKCKMCLSIMSEENFRDGMCGLCYSCLDCEEYYLDCLCYTPPKAKKYETDLAEASEYASLYPYNEYPSLYPY